MPDVRLPPFKNKGISDEVTKKLLESWKEDTKQCYKNRNQLRGSTLSPVEEYTRQTGNDVLNFLHSLKAKGFNYIIINSAISTLPAFNTLRALKTGKPPIV